MSAEDYIFEDPCESWGRGQDEPSEDFKIHNKEYFDAMYGQHPKVETTDTVDFEYIRVHHTTKKAKFFVTEEDDYNIFGYWVPKSVILNDSGNSLELQDWFQPSEIQFT